MYWRREEEKNHEKCIVCIWRDCIDIQRTTIERRKKTPITKPVQNILLNVQPCQETNNSIGLLLLFRVYSIEITTKKKKKRTLPILSNTYVIHKNNRIWTIERFFFLLRLTQYRRNNSFNTYISWYKSNSTSTYTYIFNDYDWLVEWK
jgi:hypothetical protein